VHARIKSMRAFSSFWSKHMKKLLAFALLTALTGLILGCGSSTPTPADDPKGAPPPGAKPVDRPGKPKSAE
jgi:hypothetical protein